MWALLAVSVLTLTLVRAAAGAEAGADRTLDALWLPLGTRRRHVALVVVVLSAPQNAAQRAACRATWLRTSTAAEHLFLVGQPAAPNATLARALRREAELHRDLLRVPVREHYRRLVYKVAAAYDYLALRSQGPHADLQFDFMLKTDDDSFVRLDRLLAILTAQAQLPAARDHIYWGSHNYGVKRSSSPDHKWYNGIYKDTVYPPYALGSAYALSSSLVRVIGSMEPEKRPMHPVEDVATACWLRTAIGEPLLRRVHANTTLFPLIETGKHSGVCSPSMIVRRHCDEVGLMEQFMQNLATCGDMCCGATTI